MRGMPFLRSTGVHKRWVTFDPRIMYSPRVKPLISTPHSPRGVGVPHGALSLGLSSALPVGNYRRLRRIAAIRTAKPTFGNSKARLQGYASMISDIMQ